MERRTVLKRVTVGIATAGSVSVAGCSGDGDETAAQNDDDGPTENDDETMDRDADEGTTGDTDDGLMGSDGEQTTEGDSDNGPTESGGVEGTTEAGPMVDLAMPAYEFSEGESYAYDSEWRGNTGEQAWEVLSVDGDELTIRRTYPTDEGQETIEVSAASGRIYREMLNQITGPSFFRNMRDAQFYVGAEEFAPGNTFTVDTSEREDNYDSETVEVTGETTVNGIQCTEFTVSSSSGGIVRTVCAAEGYPFPLSLHFEQAGVQLLDATLTDSNQP